jgi:ATP/maltotriose-dependent transcriptional regulator MalT
MLPGLFVIFAVTIIVWTLAFLYFRNYLRRRTGSRRILEEFQDEVDKLIAEINSATDNGLTLMEDRISSLKTLLEETDKRISVYKKESERKIKHEHAYAELGKKTIVKTDTSSLFASEPEIISPKNNLHSAKSIVPSSEDLTENDAKLSNESPRFIRSSIRVEPRTPLVEQVLHLAKAGFSNELIAKHLETSLAEVELAINLAERSNISE